MKLDYIIYPVENDNAVAKAICPAQGKVVAEGNDGQIHVFDSFDDMLNGIAPKDQGGTP